MHLPTRRDSPPRREAGILAWRRWRGEETGSDIVNASGVIEGPDSLDRSRGVSGGAMYRMVYWSGVTLLVVWSVFSAVSALTGY